MKITPEVIETMDFKVSMKGYDRKEVDLFLDDIIEEFETQLRTIQKLNEEKDILLYQLAHYKKIENELSSTFLKAQESADEIKAAAEKEYQEKMKKADSYLREINEDKYVQLEKLEKKYNILKTKYTEYKNSIKSDLKKQLAILERDEAE